MKITKPIVIAITLVLTIAFVALVYFGMTRARGAPVAVPPLQRATLVSHYKTQSLDLTQDVALADWADIPGTAVELVYQAMIPPWSKGLIPAVTAKSFHNDTELYVYVTWKDESENRALGVGEFSDAVALMFPLSNDAPPSTLMMGFMGKQGVNVWHWQATQDTEFWSKKSVSADAYSDFLYPFEEQETLTIAKSPLTSAVSDLLAVKVTTTTAKATQNVQGRGVWDKGAWHVVFKRALKATNAKEDAAFAHGARKLMAFAAWSGDKGDRGGRKSISDWVQLEFR
ncbi:MAG: hypothetical protein FJ009_03645 [Chloroflexi bacterium]|nr:hypothetical protein [Chloroflexota bacterium]